MGQRFRAPADRPLRPFRPPMAGEAGPVPRGGLWCRPEPERCPGWFHGLVDHGQELVGQGVQVELLAQAGGEPLDGGRGIVAAPVEPSVHDRLDAAADRLEQAAVARVAPALECSRRFTTAMFRPERPEIVTAA
jgi:hypothetical protein